ncbi:MAG: PHP domain-containing protein [Ruminococcaceae bacterium]|nr:PHP domain-containing protein [Oscillospiraceae bacterium]
MKKICDLHTHSTFSDGDKTPAELIDRAEKAGLSAIALCDHNTVTGLNEFVKAADGKDIIAVPGVEFSVEYMGKELHLLALYVPMNELDKYTAYVDKPRKSKEESNKQMIASLRKAGYMIDYDKILASSPSGGFNRVHVANALIEIGVLSTVEEGFATILSLEAGHYKPPMRLDAFETVKFILDTGAVPVLAHPLLNLTVEELRTFLKTAVPLGLVGMETDYSDYSEEETKISVSIAEEFGLVRSGGSDYHGDNKPEIKLGIGRGNLSIPIEFAEIIKTFAKG